MASAIIVKDVAEAICQPLPKLLESQLAFLTSVVPTCGDWLYEVDGYRILTRFQRGKPQIFTRRGYDWTDRMPALADELATVGIDSSWLDGEIVVLNDSGDTDFRMRFDRRSTARIAYYLFPFLAGRDLRGVGNRHRRVAPGSARRRNRTHPLQYSVRG